MGVRVVFKSTSRIFLKSLTSRMRVCSISCVMCIVVKPIWQFRDPDGFGMWPQVFPGRISSRTQTGPQTRLHSKSKPRVVTAMDGFEARGHEWGEDWAISPLPDASSARIQPSA
jgi:hypothetical protein